MKIYHYFNYFLLSFIIGCFGYYYFSTNHRVEKKPVFALLTDFGYDFAVASIKAVIASSVPDATIIDLDHSIGKFNVISAGFVLAKAYQYFPKGTIFTCVVDPGVGTKREPLCIKAPHYTFIGPNNGIFDFVLEQEKDSIIYQISESYIKTGANTFHGRDLFAPAAIDFYKGNLQHFTVFDKSKLVHTKAALHEAIATYIDSFGNIKTNKSVDSLVTSKNALTLTIHRKKHQIPLVKTFNDVPVNHLLCYTGSNGTLEIAVNQGSAAQFLHVNVGDTLTLENE